MMKIRFYAISLALIVLFTTGCAKRETAKPKEAVNDEKAQGEAATDAVQQKILSFNLEGLSEKGKKTWEVQGESATAISENEIRLANITAKSYGDESLATITAEKGIYDKLKNNVRLEENVKAVVENTQFFAEDQLGLPSQTAGESKPKDDGAVGKSKNTVITCDGEVEFNYEKNSGYFNKNVKVTSDDGDIDADKITMHLDPKTKKISDIVCEGNVRISRGENTTYSEKATYIEAEKKVVLVGKPKLILYEEGNGNFMER